MLKRNLVLFVLLLGVLVLPLSVSAQEVTATPTAIVGDPVIPAPDPGPARETILLDVLAIVGAVGGGFLAGRYSQGIGAAARELEKNKLFLDASERLATTTIPVSALDTIRGILSDAQVGLDILKKITDGVPNDVAVVQAVPGDVEVNVG